MSHVRVEFFGLARSRTGVESVDIEAGTLGEVVTQLSAQFPALADTCFEDGAINRNWLFSLNGRVFTRDPSAVISPGDTLLLLSADAGGC